MGVIAGLAFPLLDFFLTKHSSFYDEKTSEKAAWKVYREGPILYKLYAALLPVINLVWIIGIVMLIFCVVRYHFNVKKYAIEMDIVKWLAERPNKKYFVLRYKIVKLLFPGHKIFFMNIVTMQNSNKLAQSLISILNNALNDLISDEIDI